MPATRLFATLDPTMRADRPAVAGATSILSDTVGFITDLPTELVAAFRATLEEVLEADLILHVRDISHPDSRGAEAAMSRRCWPSSASASEARAARLIEVWNKIDLLTPEQLDALQAAARVSPASTCSPPRRRRASTAAGGRRPAARGEPDRGRARPRLQCGRAWPGCTGTARCSSAATTASVHLRCVAASERAQLAHKLAPRRSRPAPGRSTKRPARSRQEKAGCGRPRPAKLGRKRLKSGVVGETPWTCEQPT